MKISALLAAALFLLSGWPGAAEACTRPQKIFHEATRGTYPGPIVAEVEIYGARNPGGRVEARVRRMIRGPADAEVLVLRPYPTHVCHSPPQDGSRGIIVARPRGMDGGTLVVTPITR